MLLLHRYGPSIGPLSPKFYTHSPHGSPTRLVNLLWCLSLRAASFPSLGSFCFCESSKRALRCCVLTLQFWGSSVNKWLIMRNQDGGCTAQSPLPVKPLKLAGSVPSWCSKLAGASMCIDVRILVVLSVESDFCPGACRFLFPFNVRRTGFADASRTICWNLNETKRCRRFKGEVRSGRDIARILHHSCNLGLGRALHHVQQRAVVGCTQCAQLPTVWNCTNTQLGLEHVCNEVRKNIEHDI